MARFNAGADPAEGVPAGGLRAGSVEEVPGGRPKASLHPTFSSGAPAFGKKPALEGSLSGGSVTGTPKPSFLKSTGSTKSAPEVCEFPRPKPLAAKFGAPQEEGRPAVTKQQAFKPKLPDLDRDSEPKPLYPKVPVQKVSLSATAEGKTCPRPPPALTKPPLAQAKPPPALNKSPLGLATPASSPSKPSWLKDNPKSEHGGGGGGPLNTPKMPLGPKPKSSASVPRNQEEEGSGTPPLSQKPSSFRAAQSRFNKENSDTQGPEKSNLTPLNSHDPLVPKLSNTQRGSFVRLQKGQKENNDPSAPKRNLLLNKLALGSPPAKPNGPPNVNLEKFTNPVEASGEAPSLSVHRVTQQNCRFLLWGTGFRIPPLPRLSLTGSYWSDIIGSPLRGRMT